MKRFSRLYAEIDATNSIGEKVAAMVDYFRAAPPDDSAWAVFLLCGKRPRRAIAAKDLARWAAEHAQVPDWLLEECCDAVGDLAETAALLAPCKTHRVEEWPLHRWLEDFVLRLPALSEERRRAAVIDAWDRMDATERLVLNKLVTGAFRIAVSPDWVVRALSRVGGLSPSVVAQRLMGDWHPTGSFYEMLMREHETQTLGGRPYPFCRANPLNGDPEDLGPVDDWSVEWKWDGIRAQVVRRGGVSYVWLREEELISRHFPEIAVDAESLPDGTVLDGEVVAWRDGRPTGFAELRRRIDRKTASKKIAQDVPVVLVVFDLLEENGIDLRDRPLSYRRERLVRLFSEVDRPTAILSPRVLATTWTELMEMRGSRSLGVDGLMLKRLDSPYGVGRENGSWWKWKAAPISVRAVLIYAQSGSGMRASLFTDYTFGLWSEGKLVSFAKTGFGLSEEEIRRVDAFVRRSTIERFGPVRTVRPELVMELALEGIELSSRHKSGVAVRSPRILRWRHDVRPEDADTLDGIKDLLCPRSTDTPDGD